MNRKTVKNRFVLKISGEALSGAKGFGSDPEILNEIAGYIIEAHAAGFQIAVVVGGGNYFRGGSDLGWTIPRAERDNVGILGTVMNGIFLRGALLASAAAEVRLMTAIAIPAMGEPFIRLRADNHLNQGRIVILAGGNGQPFVTTDYPAVQRAIELDAEALLVAKNGVGGVMTADPRADANAELMERVTYDEVIDKRLRVMDQAAFVLAMENDLKLQVFDVADVKNLKRICGGEFFGTVIGS